MNPPGDFIFGGIFVGESSFVSVEYYDDNDTWIRSVSNQGGGMIHLDYGALFGDQALGNGTVIFDKRN